VFQYHLPSSTLTPTDTSHDAFTHPRAAVRNNTLSDGRHIFYVEQVGILSISNIINIKEILIRDIKSLRRETNSLSHLVTCSYLAAKSISSRNGTFDNSNTRYLGLLDASMIADISGPRSKGEK